MTIVTKEIFFDELKHLTSAISYQKITTSEFEVPWDSFASDQKIRTADHYHALLQFADISENGLNLLGAALTDNTINYPNSVVKKYTLRHHQWAMADFSIEIIKNFMQDPGYGLEAILGTRIRHNELEREFTESIERVASGNITGVLKNNSIPLFVEFKKAIKETVVSWIDIYIHTERK